MPEVGLILGPLIRIKKKKTSKCEKGGMHSANGGQQEAPLCKGELRANQYITMRWDSALTSHSLQNPSFEPEFLRESGGHYWDLGKG